jgi:hypothetical protein
VVLRLVVSAFALSVLLPAVAPAATVSPLSGEVRVSTGQGFEKIAAPTEVAAGAQVMVSPGGSATIAYAQDCLVSADPGRVAVVQRWSPCQALPEPMHFTPKVKEAKVNEEKKPSDDQAAPPPPPPPPPVVTQQSSADEGGDGSSHPSFGTYCLIGGVVVGAGVLAAILVTQNNDNPVSP